MAGASTATAAGLGLQSNKGVVSILTGSGLDEASAGTTATAAGSGLAGAVFGGVAKGFLGETNLGSKFAVRMR